MNRDEQEMALWRCVYEHWFPRHGYEPEECSGIADAAVAEFRLRYPPQAAGNGDPDTSPIRDLLEAITGDSAFTGCGDSLQSRIYAAVDALRNGRLTEPPAAWYNEPPFPKDGIDRPCWITGGEKPILGEVYWFDVEWRMCVIGDDYSQPLNGRRVCPIAKPPEPTK